MYDDLALRKAGLPRPADDQRERREVRVVGGHDRPDRDKPILRLTA